MKSYLAIGLVTMLAATAARAEVMTKGGAAGLFNAPATRSAATAIPRSGCGACCKSEFRTLTVPTFKGTTPRTVTVENHACPNCGTEWVSSGHGKARTETAVHACGGCKS